jgi:hypothetical protein
MRIKGVFSFHHEAVLHSLFLFYSFELITVLSMLGVFWGEQKGICRVLVLDGRLQDEGETGCVSGTNSKFKLCDMYVTGYVHM